MKSFIIPNKIFIDYIINISKYMLYVYLNFIKEDWETCKKWSIPFLKPAWIVRSTLIWISSIIFFPFFHFGMIFEANIKRIKELI